MFNATGSGAASKLTTESRRAAALAAVGAAATALAACGSSGTSSSSPTASASSTSSTAAAAARLTVGSKSIRKSTLASGQPAEFVTNPAVRQTARGLVLRVSANHQTTATNANSYGVPQSLEVGVTVTPPSSPKLLYGVGCQGSPDFGQQYLGLTDSTGNWEILQQNGKKITTLATGTAQLSSGNTQINLACARPSSPKSTTRLSLALDGTIVKTVDHTDPHFTYSNEFQLVLVDPRTGTAGSATFHNLDVRSATAE